MHQIRETSRRLDRVILLFLFALFLLISPMLDWWASDESPWYLLYLMWLFLIALCAWLHVRVRAS